MSKAIFLEQAVNNNDDWINKLCTQVNMMKLRMLWLFVLFLGLSAPSWAIEKGYAVFGDGDGVIYAIPADGNLRWFQHRGRMDGSVSWANGGVLKNVGTGWSAPIKTFSGGDGVIYTITSDGVLHWYRHNGRFTGVFDWANGGSSAQVGIGWQEFIHVFSSGDGDGVIYGVRPNGDLVWFRHTGRFDGSFVWDGSSGVVVGYGWQKFQRVFSSGDGVIYGIDPKGILSWYRHDGRFTGTFDWASNSGAVVGSGWQDFRQVFSSGDGIIYAVRNNGELAWYRHKGWLTGEFNWTAAVTVGTGWLVP